MSAALSNQAAARQLLKFFMTAWTLFGYGPVPSKRMSAIRTSYHCQMVLNSANDKQPSYHNPGNPAVPYRTRIFHRRIPPQIYFPEFSAAQQMEAVISDSAFF